MKSILFIILSFLLLSPCAHAKDLYVDTGSIGGACSDLTTRLNNDITHPYCTLARLVATETDGDVAYIRSGTYAEGTLALAQSGSGTGSKITWKNYPAEAPILQITVNANAKSFRRFEGTSVSNRLVFDGAGTIDRGIYSNAGANQYIELINCEIKTYLLNGVYLSNCTNYSIDGSYIHNIGDTSGTLDHGDCVLISGTSSGSIKNSEVYYCDDDCVTMNTDTLIDNSIIHHCLRPVEGSAHGDCIEGGSGIVKNSTIYDCGNAGISIEEGADLVAYNNILYRTGAEGNWWIQLRGVARADIYNNTMYNSALGGVRLLDGSISPYSKARNVTIKNNIFHTMNGGAPPISLDTGKVETASYVSNYNIFYGMISAKPTIITAYEGVDKDLAGMIALSQEQNSISGSDPLLSNVVSYNFRLSTASPAINTGTDLSLIFTTDIIGTTRPQNGAWDIGAYEYFTTGSFTGSMN
jgi:hypothetical protein